MPEEDCMFEYCLIRSERTKLHAQTAQMMIYNAVIYDKELMNQP